MGSINLRIDDELKARSYAALEKMGVTPSGSASVSCSSISLTMNACRSNRHSWSDEDAELVEIVKERLL